MRRTDGGAEAFLRAHRQAEGPGFAGSRNSLCRGSEVGRAFSMDWGECRLDPACSLALTLTLLTLVLAWMSLTPKDGPRTETGAQGAPFYASFIVSPARQPCPPPQPQFSLCK